MQMLRIYADEGISASKALHKRKGILQLLEDAEKGEFDVILFKDLTRWSRNPSQFYAVQDRLDKCHVSWIAVEQESLETVSASGRLLVGIHISVSAHESSVIGERIKFVNESRIKKGLPVTGQMPLGFMIDERTGQKRIVINEDERDLVMLAFDTFEQTQCVAKVSEALRQHGRMMYETSVRRLLRNPMYKGSFRGVDGYCESYIDEERWNRIQSLMSVRHYTPPTKDRFYLFSSLVQCDDCGRRMAGHTKRGTVYYSCPNHGLHLCDHSKMIREDFIESSLLAQLDEHLKNVTATVRSKKKRPPTNKAKLDRLKDLYIDGDISKEEYLRRKEKCRISTSDESTDLSPKVIKDWREYYDKAGRDAKQTAWRSIIEKIVVDRENHVSVLFR